MSVKIAQQGGGTAIMSRLFSLHYKKNSGFKTERVMPNKKRRRRRRKKKKKEKEEEEEQSGLN